MMENGADLKKAIDDRAPEIIGVVNDFAAKHRGTITMKKKDGKLMFGKKQFTDLVEASSQACCIEEFKLYIKYKGAKEGTKSLWSKLADPFNLRINDLMGIVADEIEKDNETVKLEVLKRFCAYLMWRVHADMEEASVPSVKKQ